MGGHLGSHNTQYQYLLFDFLEQASRFARIKTMTDDQREFLDFWRKNKEKLSNIQLMREKIWHELDANRPRWSPESVPVLVSNSTTRLAAPNSSLNNPPLKESVCKDAVKTSVKILKSIAAMCLAAQNIQEEA